MFWNYPIVRWCVLETVCVTLFSLRISSDFVLSACLIEEESQNAGEVRDFLKLLNICRGV